MHPGMFVFGVIVPLMIVVLVVYGVWELARSRGDGAAVVGTAGGPSVAARAILDERFARGELDAPEYVQRRALLDGTVVSPPVEADAVYVPNPTAGVESSDPVPVDVDGEAN